MLSISILLPDLRGGGAERVSADLARAFASLGHRVEFVLMRETGEFFEEVQREFSIHVMGVSKARRALSPLYRYLRSKSPDVLLAQMWPLTVLAPVAARVAGFRGKVVICEHGILSRQYQDWGLLQRLTLRLSTFIGYRLATGRVGVSHGTCRDMAALSMMRRGSFSAIHNPVRMLAAPNAAELVPATAQWGGDGPRILTVGNLKPVKNHSLLLRAFARLSRRDARLMIVGHGEEESRLRALAARLGVADRLTMAGFQSDPSPLYAAADLFVLSSDHEGFGNVIVEALSFGLNVVSTDCPSGPAEILLNGRFGRLVPVGDEMALASAIDMVLSAPADPATQKSRAADFAPEIAARRYLELLDLS